MLTTDPLSIAMLNSRLSAGICKNPKGGSPGSLKFCISIVAQSGGMTVRVAPFLTFPEFI